MAEMSDALKAQLAAMRDTPVMPDGWDVALHLSQAAVQALIRFDWAGVAGPETARSVNWIAPAEEDGKHVLIDLQAVLGLPQVGLDADHQSASLAFEIDRGQLRVGKIASEELRVLREPGALAASQSVTWDETIEITPQSAVHLRGAAPLTVISSQAGEEFSVVLNLDAAELALTDNGPDTDITSRFGPTQLLPWMTVQGLTGQIATVATAQGALAHALSPSKVAARIVKGRGGAPVLQMLTAGNPNAGVAELAVPVPQDDDHDFGLVVSSQAAVGMIANSYNAGTGVVKLNTEKPQEGLPHWYMQVREPMVFQGAFGIDGGETFHSDHSDLYMRFGGSTQEGVKLFTHIDPNSTVALELDLAAHFPLTISGEGVKQLVGLCDGAQSVEGTGFYEQLVVPQLRSFLTGDIRDDMSRVTMEPLSQLALDDIMLSGHSLTYEAAALPGELVVMGRLDTLTG